MCAKYEIDGGVKLATTKKKKKKKIEKKPRTKIAQHFQ